MSSALLVGSVLACKVESFGVVSRIKMIAIYPITIQGHFEAKQSHPGVQKVPIHHSL